MKISVITACHNAAATLCDCVESVARQKVSADIEVEHLIVDGASSDSTPQLLEQWGKRFSIDWVSEPDEGLYFAMNKGIARASGDVIGILNADDWYASKDVLADVACTLADSRTDACYADLKYVRQHDPHKVVRNWRAGEFREGAFFRGWMLPHPTFFARREVYKQFGDFDTRYRLGADWELLFRFLEVEKISVAYVPKQWVTMRLGGATNRSLRNIIANHRECLHAFREHGHSANLTFPIRKICHRLRQFFTKPE